MKKLAVHLQIIALLAVCPVYVILEINHASNGKSAVSRDSSVKPKTETKNAPVSAGTDDKTQSAPYNSTTK